MKGFIPYAELTEEQKNLVNDISHEWERKFAAQQGFGLDVLVNDSDPDVRRAVAEHGYGLDKLISDDLWFVRKAVAEQGFGLGVLVNDEESAVRKAVAEQGFGLDALVSDPCNYVRRTVVEQGYGLDALATDTDKQVIADVALYLLKNNTTLEQWIAENPDRCALHGNRALETKAIHANPATDVHDHAVIARFGEDALLFTSLDDPTPYIIAHGYDPQTRSWSSGTYRSDLGRAWEEINPEIIEHATIRWEREDFRSALKEAGIEPTDENTQSLINGSWGMEGWRDRAIEDGNEHIADLASTMRKQMGISAPAVMRKGAPAYKPTPAELAANATDRANERNAERCLRYRPIPPQAKERTK